MAFALIAVAVFVTGPFTSTLPAQDLAGKISCHATDVQKGRGRVYRKRLWGGFEISLGPSRARRGDGDECTAAIYDSAGRVVFRTTGFNVVFDENHTGQDFDGDGKPEVVFITDSGGGMHCCWSYSVVSLAPKPRKLFEIDAPGAVRFEKDNDGRMIIWQRNTGPYGFTSNAAVPAAEKAFRLRDGKLVDATPDLCPRIFSAENEDYRIWTSRLTAADIGRMRATGPRAVENEETVSSLLSRALQHVFCEQFDLALADLDLWPEPTRAQMKSEFAQFVRKEHPEFADRLLGR